MKIDDLQTEMLNRAGKTRPQLETAEREYALTADEAAALNGLRDLEFLKS